MDTNRTTQALWAYIASDQIPDVRIYKVCSGASNVMMIASNIQFVLTYTITSGIAERVQKVGVISVITVLDNFRGSSYNTVLEKLRLKKCHGQF